MIKKLVLISFLATLIGTISIGCTRQGIYFDINQADNLVPGVTTEEDAISLFGEPRSREDCTDGSYILRWSFIEDGLIVDRGYYLALLFDKRGYLIEVIHKDKHKKLDDTITQPPKGSGPYPVFNW